MKSSSMVFLLKKIIVIFFELLILWHSASDFKFQSTAQNVVKQLPQAEVSSVNALIYQFKSRKLSTTISATYCSNIASNYGLKIACSQDCYLPNEKACHISTLICTSSGLSGTVSEAIGDLTGLTQISLSDNKLTGQIPNSLGSLSNLQTLDLSYNQLTGTIPASLGKLRSLQFLYLRYNFLQGSIPPSLGETSLQELFLDYNKLSGSIPSSLGKLTNLVYLQLSENKLNGKLPTELGNLINLNSFWMPSNYFSGKLPKSFENLINLRWFSVAGNNLDGSLPGYIAKWVRLEALWLQGNKFKGPLPPEYFKMPMLNQMLISDLQGGESQFPDDANISNMNRLVLRSCSLSGSFPAFISELTSLTHLDLSFNKLTGVLPDSMRPNLLYMSLARNNLNGTIPIWVTQASGTRMDLSYNNFSNLETPVTSDQDLNLFSCCCCEVSQGATEPYMHSPMNMMKSYFGNEKPKYYSLYINSGGEQTKSNATKYEADNSTLPVYISASRNWAYSFSGDFLSPTVNPSDCIQRIPQRIYNSEMSVYEDARLSPVSLDYYGFSLIKGSYNVTLQFAEIVYSDKEDYKILRKRYFDIRIQDVPVKEEFSIIEQAGGPNKATSLTFKTEVNESSILSIHLYWAGKGSYLEPPTFNGPLISAVSVVPLFKVKLGLTPWQIALITLASFLVATLLLLALAWSLGWLEKKEFKENIKVGERSVSDNLMEDQKVTLRQLVIATGNFSDENKIGSGELGAVYKAYIKSYDVTVAVKKYHPRYKGKIHGQIIKETHLLMTVKSGKLVRLLHAHIGESLQLCIYEYVEKESLEIALFETATETISWDKRYNICQGIAEGLESLHDHHTKIVHGNLKCSNVLLAKDYNPKLSDFGYAGIYSDDDKFSVVKKGASRGHIAPEYCHGDPVSVKTDIYSFGVILLEIVAGHRNNERIGDEKKDLVDKVHGHVRAKTPSVIGFVDRRLKGNYNPEQVERVLGIAELCTNFPSLRPCITDILSVLQGEKTVDDISPNLSIVKSISASTSGSFK